MYVKGKIRNSAGSAIPVFSVNTSWEKNQQIDFLFSLYLLLDISSFDFFFLIILIGLYFFLFVLHSDTGHEQSIHIMLSFQIMPEKNNLIRIWVVMCVRCFLSTTCVFQCLLSS